MDIQRWAGGLVLIVLLTLSVLVGGPLWYFFDVASLLLTFGGGFAAWLAISGRGVGQAFAVAGGAPASPSDQQVAAATARAGRRAFWLVAGLGTMIGLTQIIQSIDDLAAVGPAIAVCLLTLTYAFLADLFIVSPLAHRIEVRRLAAGSAPPSEQAIDRELAAAKDALDALTERARVSRSSAQAAPQA